MLQEDFFVFREARSVKELEALLRLRYRVYQQSRFNFLIPENDFAIQLDYYDLRSRHFGLFKNNITPVGYHRPVFETCAPLYQEVLEIASRFPEAYKRCHSKQEQPFPVMTYWPDCTALNKFYKSSKAEGKTIAEATRFSLESSASSLVLATHIIESEMAVQVFTGLDYALMACTKGHFRFYQRYGFVRLEGSKDESVDKLTMSCTLLDSQNIPAILQGRIDSMANAFAETGQICYTPSNPNQFYAPNAVQNTRTMVAVAA